MRDDWLLSCELLWWLMMQVFIRWMWRVCLSSLSPTSSFPSRITALSVLAVFLHELPQPRLSRITFTLRVLFTCLLTFLVLGARFSQQAHCLTPAENAGIDINSFGWVAEGMISQQTAFVYPYRGQCKQKYSWKQQIPVCPNYDCSCSFYGRPME